MKSAVVKLNIERFREWYPQFEATTDGMLESYFAQACVLIDNTPTSKIPFDPEDEVYIREIMLYLMMCHLITLANRPNGVSGPLTSASEGSVSTGWGTLNWSNETAAWFAQTACGQTLWEMLAAYRMGPLWYSGGVKPHPWG